MATKKAVKKTRKLKMSMTFKKATAAVAMSKLMQGAHNEDSAARFVIVKVGDLIFPNKNVRNAADALIKFRCGIINEGKSRGKFVSIARFHYFYCLKLIDSKNSEPKYSADILLKTLLVGTGKSG